MSTIVASTMSAKSGKFRPLLQFAAAVEELAKKLEQRRTDLEQCAENFVRSEEIRRYLSTFSR